MQRLVDTAAGLCGIPTTVKASRKYQLAKTPIEIPFHHEDFEVEKVYLKPESASMLLHRVGCLREIMLEVLMMFSLRCYCRNKQGLFVRALPFAVWHPRLRHDYRPLPRHRRRVRLLNSNGVLLAGFEY